MDKFVVKRKKENQDEPVKRKKIETPQEGEEKLQEKAEVVRRERITEIPEFLKKNEPSNFGDISLTEVLTIPAQNLHSPAEYFAYFTKLAQYLLNEVTLMVNGEPHRLVEIEFYFTNDEHPDPYTHHDAVQEECARWYFHRTGGSYRGGNYKGLDISIGQSKTEYGGILIRTIESLKDKKIICGPCKSVDHILERCSAPSIVDLVKEQLKHDITIQKSEGKVLYLDNTSDRARLPVFFSPRVGLFMTKPKKVAKEQKDFLFRYYRFFTQPVKVVKGRHYMFMGWHGMGLKREEIFKFIESKGDSIPRLIKFVEEGRGKDPDSYLGQRLSDNETCVCFGSLLGNMD